VILLGVNVDSMLRLDFWSWALKTRLLISSAIRFPYTPVKLGRWVGSRGKNKNKNKTIFALGFKFHRLILFIIKGEP
jgi:hypothetical protein